MKTKKSPTKKSPTKKNDDDTLVRGALAVVTHALEVQTRATLQIVEAFTRPPAPFIHPELVAAVVPLFTLLGQVLARPTRPGASGEQPHQAHGTNGTTGTHGDARKAH